MITQTVPKAVTSVLDRMILAKKVFTAYDVTQEARKLTTDSILLSDVKDIVRTKFTTGQMPGYNRNYKFEDVEFVSVYRPDKSSDTVIEDTPEETTIVENTDTNVSIDSGTVVKLTKDGRVNIPKELLKQITMVDGSYDIYISDTHKCVSPNTNGCIRFGLRSFGITGDKVSLVVDTNSIRISEVS